MFKKSLFISTAILASVSLAGCGSTAPKNATPTSPSAQTQQTTSNAAKSITVPNTEPDFIGKVTAVANGELTINKAEPSAKPQGAHQTDRESLLKLSNEVDTLTIPATAQVVRGRDNNISVIKASDIKKDQIIRVWEKDGAITFVQVVVIKFQ